MSEREAELGREVAALKASEARREARMAELYRQINGWRFENEQLRERIRRLEQLLREREVGGG